MLCALIVSLAPYSSRLGLSYLNPLLHARKLAHTDVIKSLPPRRIAVNTIIVGGGHAGVNLACMLELHNSKESTKVVDYLILE
jgi:hypothetical protein